MAGNVHDIAGCRFDGKVKPTGWTRLCMRACNASFDNWLETDATQWRQGTANGGAQDPQLILELENIVSAQGATIGKQRIFTTNATTVTAQNYTVS